MQRNKIYKKSFRQNRAAQYNERRQEKQARLYDSGKSGRRTGKVVLTPCASFRTGISLLWERPRRFALGTRPARCRCRILRAGKTGTVFPPRGEALLWTGRRVPERHTAPVGAEPAFLPGMTSTAKPHGGMEGGAPEKYPQLLGFAQKSRGPWPKGGNFLGRGHSLRLLPPEVTRGTSRC